MAFFVFVRWLLVVSQSKGTEAIRDDIFKHGHKSDDFWLYTSSKNIVELFRYDKYKYNTYLCLCTCVYYLCACKSPNEHHGTEPRHACSCVNLGESQEKLIVSLGYCSCWIHAEDVIWLEKLTQNAHRPKGELTYHFCSTKKSYAIVLHFYRWCTEMQYITVWAGVPQQAMNSFSLSPFTQPGKHFLYLHILLGKIQPWIGSLYEMDLINKNNGCIEET